MKFESQAIDSGQGRGVGGIARVVAMLCVLAAAIVGILTVLEVIPRDVLDEYAVKLVGVGAIALLASIAIALLSKR